MIGRMGLKYCCLGPRLGFRWRHLQGLWCQAGRKVRFACPVHPHIVSHRVERRIVRAWCKFILPDADYSDVCGVKFHQVVCPEP